MLLQNIHTMSAATANSPAIIFQFSNGLQYTYASMAFITGPEISQISTGFFSLFSTKSPENMAAKTGDRV